MKHCNSLVPYFVSFSYSDAFLYIDPTGTRFASGSARLLIHSFPFHLFAGLCVLTPLPREGNAVAKGGRGQLTILQVLPASLKPPLGGWSTG
ncbi:MAG: hypothetical protein EZS28_037322 [Streblomastix strix]|uniref:Uncharacterized protein n=1 Tax=Streblomastix strix TaxID=222440 RepID=A0A5J4UAC2_9EUKA|nr:MAG: hypothetical protein EZS28_037322 [Streblomastix strix]